MRFVENNIFGVYVAPIVPMMLAAWAIVAILRHFADHYGLLRHVWHPALFVIALYLIVLGSIVLLTAFQG